MISKEINHKNSFRLASAKFKTLEHYWIFCLNLGEFPKEDVIISCVVLQILKALHFLKEELSVMHRGEYIALSH